MAYIIENSVILSAMSEKLQDVQQNVQMMYSSQINDIEFPDHKASDYLCLYMCVCVSVSLYTCVFMGLVVFGMVLFGVVWFGYDVVFLLLAVM